MTRVLIAERHEATRAGIRAALEAAGHDVVADCADAASAVEAADRTRPAVCMVDLDLPGGGIAALRALASRRRPPRIVVLASRVRDDEFFAALCAGARGFVVKDIDPERLPGEVEVVVADGAALSPELTARLIEEFRSLARAPQAEAGKLSAREREVLELLAAEELTTKQVAARLGLSPTTVRRHVSSAVAKLGAADRQAAIDAARRRPGLDRFSTGLRSDPGDEPAREE